ncbi:MAG: hypothetical protein LBM93_01910, partial [Oscillospiraceae bacterium]|nr:hypothetical protein [Oscillospiraceae bacterium]
MSAQLKKCILIAALAIIVAILGSRFDGSMWFIISPIILPINAIENIHSAKKNRPEKLDIITKNVNIILNFFLVFYINIAIILFVLYLNPSLDNLTFRWYHLW